MGNLKNIFLIYSSKDNNIAVHENLGWVDTFGYFLKILLNQIAGWSPEINLVNDLSTLDFKEKHIMVIISSDNLVRDDKSKAVLDQLKKLDSDQKISEDKIIKVQKNYFPKEEEPEFLHHFKDYSFYKANGLSGSRSEYKDFFSTPEEKTFWVKLTDLAYEILAFTEKKGSGHLDISSYSVFLADTNTMAEKYRNNLKRDMQSMGLNIWPKSTFSDNSSDFILKLDENVKKSDFAIHIIGNGFSSSIGGTNHTKEEIQAKITENFSSLYRKNNKGAVYRRFFWFDKVGILTNEKIGNFYKELSVQVENFVGTELVVSSWEEFKSLIFQFTSFELPTIKATKKSVSKKEQKIIYFLYDAIDEEYAQPVIKQLRKQKYQVITSNFDGDILAVRHIHMESLKRFDYAFIFAYKSGVQWINMKMLDVFKAPGFGREKPILKKVLIIPTTIKDELNPSFKMFDILRYEGEPGKEIVEKILLN